MRNARSRGTWRRTCFSTKLKSITKTTWSYPPKPLRSSNYKHNRRQLNSNQFWCANLIFFRSKLHALGKSAHTHTHTHTQLKSMYSHYGSLSLSLSSKECMTVAHHPCARSSNKECVLTNHPHTSKGHMSAFHLKWHFWGIWNVLIFNCHFEVHYQIVRRMIWLHLFMFFVGDRVVFYLLYNIIISTNAHHKEKKETIITQTKWAMIW